jgi:signal transduction histidine kinase
MSTTRIVTTPALMLFVLYAFAWSVTPTVLRLVEARPFTLVMVTITSCALFGVGLVLFNTRVVDHGHGLRPLVLIALALVSLAAVAIAGVAVWASELIIWIASFFGSLTTRFFLSGFIVAAIASLDLPDDRPDLYPQRPVALQLVWPIQMSQNVTRDGKIKFEGGLPLIVLLAAALIHRLSSDLGKARAQFRAMGAGEFPRFAVSSGREESGGLLRRIAHFASQLSRREFLERLNTETRARAEQLGKAARDLTETNNQRLHAERFSAIAGIVATVSHELRNPVAQIAGNLPLIASYVEVTARGMRELPVAQAATPGLLGRTAKRLSASGRDVEESARRAALILGDLNAVSATPLRALEEVDLPAVIERSVRLTLRAPEVRLECVLEPVPKLTARAGELEQVVANLIENAVDAVTPVGTVSVRLRRTGAAVLLEVEDDGPGMTQEVLSRATEPFFTTKPKGKGTGLGLAIAVAIVRAHEGTLELLSHEGAGTRVDVRLPLREQARA